jgi:hypothetical protein
MYYNPTYMNPIMKGLNQGQPQQQEPLEGIASLAPTQPSQPSQPIPPQMTEGIETLDTSNPTGPALVQQMQGRMQQQDIKPPAFMAYFKDVMDTGGYPTKTMQDYYNQFGDNSLQPLPVLDGEKSLPFDIAPITPYARNENLDLTNRGSIMDEYNKYIQGGMGSRFSTMDVRGGYSFMGEDMAPGSSTGFGDFRNFLDTYGIGDRLQLNPGSLESVQPLQQTGSGLQGLAAYQSQQNTGPGI